MNEGASEARGGAERKKGPVGPAVPPWRERGRLHKKHQKQDVASATT